MPSPTCTCGHQRIAHRESADNDYCLVTGCPCGGYERGQFTPDDLADQAFQYGGDAPLAWHLSQWAENYPDAEEDTASHVFMLAVTAVIIARIARSKES